LLPPMAFWFAVPDLGLVAPNLPGAFMMWRGMAHLHGTLLSTNADGEAVKPTGDWPGPHGIAVYAKPLLARNAMRLAQVEAEHLPRDKEMEEEKWEIGSPLWQLGMSPPEDK